MAFKQGGKTRIGIGVLVLFGLALSILLVMFSISCQATAQSPSQTAV